MITRTRPDSHRDPRIPDPLDGIDDEMRGKLAEDEVTKERILFGHWEKEETTSEIHPDRFFLILFLRSSSIYRTWIKKDDFTNFREKFQKARTLEATPEDIKKRFFQFGRHDEFDLLDIS